jgi:putative ABC transport system substrate-binding protein
MAIVLSTLAIIFSADILTAQQQPKVAKVGEMVFRGRSTLGSGRTAFRQALRELGYIDGKNIIFESRSAEGELSRFPVLAEELVRLKVDVLSASSSAETVAFKNATKTIPIVFVLSSDPVANGLIDSLAHPGGNITGVTSIATVLAGKRLELLKEIVPKLSRVAVLWNPRDDGDVQFWKENQVPARDLGLQLHSVQASSVEKLEDAFKEAKSVHSDALTVASSSVFAANPKFIAEMAVRYRLAAIFDREDFIAIGGLMSYGPHRSEAYRRAAVYVDKILKGAKPADLPVEQPTKFELVINLKAAKQIGLTIPQSVLYRADRVIK